LETATGINIKGHQQVKMVLTLGRDGNKAEEKSN
jgi:hypothetical protein